MINHRDLTKSEINALSFEMRCCWFICPWNIYMDGTTVDEWAEQVGHMAYPDNSSSIMNIGDPDAVMWAKHEAKRLITFIDEQIYKERPRG